MRRLLAFAVAAACAVVPLGPATAASPEAATPAEGAPPPAGAAPLFPYAVRRHTLANGVELLFVRQEAPQLAAFFTFFRVGSRDEVAPGRSGYAHLFERLHFRGTREHPSDLWERSTKDLGLEANAFTDDDVTAYWAAGPSASLPELIALEADRFANLEYGEEEYLAEARALLGDYLKDAASPDFRLHEAVRALAFTRHPYRHTSMGLGADIRAMPGGYRASQELYHQFYRPGNATVLVVGDFDEASVLEALEKHYGAWRPPSAPAPIQPPAEPPQSSPREARRSWPVPLLPRHYTGWRTPGAEDLDATAVQLVLWPYLFGPSSALAQELLRDRRLAESIGGEYLPRRDPFLFGASLVLRAPAAERLARVAIEKAVAAVAGGAIDARLLADVRENLASSVLMQTDTPYRTGLWLVYTTALTGNPGFLETLLQRAAQVEAKDLAAFARRYLVPANRVSVTIASGTGVRGSRGNGK